MTPVSDARQAKAALQEILRDDPNVVGVGLTRQDQGYAVKVNLNRPPPRDWNLPRQLNGVPVRWEVVGVISARSS